MASLGHTVVGVDVDAQKIEMLASGRVPFYEPGFDELLREQLGNKVLTEERFADGTGVLLLELSPAPILTAADE